MRRATDILQISDKGQRSTPFVGDKERHEEMTQTPDSLGKPVASIPVELSTRFLEHFSEQLYSSPQKAFEELISNGWDAGANIVDVRVATDLHARNATMAVFDNGASMDLAGLRALWHIAFSPKEGLKSERGRPLIGKFGIGKLATYVLAEKLTYICKAEDGRIRSVTMNYGEVDTQKSSRSDRLINNFELDVFELNTDELSEALDPVYGGKEIFQLIKSSAETAPRKCSSFEPAATVSQDEFGGEPSKLNRLETDTWTLVVLSELKQVGREMKISILRRMLAAALPFGSEMAINLNGDRLRSAKVGASVVEKWVVGPSLGIEYVEFDEMETSSDIDEGNASDDDASHDKKSSVTQIPVKSGADPYPYIEIPDLGRITGTIQLFDEKIGGGKIDKRGSSNGFHVNVLGRVVNQHDSSFGEENLNHAAWARFRMTVRADGLNEYLTTNREQFKERREVKIFRAFLRKSFNKARSAYDSDSNSMISDGRDVLVRSLGLVSLNPLRSVVSETLRTHPPVIGLFDETGIDDREEKRRSWREETADNIKNALGKVIYERLDDDSFAKFRLSDGAIVVNKGHPFVAEHSRSKAQKELIRTVAMIDLLADVYALDIGVDSALLSRVRDYRDGLMRIRAIQSRQSGVLIARILKESQHDSENSKRLEAAVSDALRYLDFDVQQLGQSGEPEGIARAFTTPTNSQPAAEIPRMPLYSFTFDAKSSKHSVAKTGNIALDAIVEHRDRYKANHALVIAPGFSNGALAIRCEQQEVTPMTAGNLGKLLEYTVEYGAIPVTTIRDVFRYFTPEEVSNWVESLAGRLETNRKLTIDVFINALEELKGKVPETLSASMVAFICRENLGVLEVKEKDVILLAKGLQVLVPDLVGVDDDKIVVNASASSVAEAVDTQLEKLHRGDG
ncbi:MAG: ATP-binding protein [Albidovulum sp.]|nr:ATP-binding protein [Albidovulum sp.]